MWSARRHRRLLVQTFGLCDDVTLMLLTRDAWFSSWMMQALQPVALSAVSMSLIAITPVDDTQQRSRVGRIVCATEHAAVQFHGTTCWLLIYHHCMLPVGYLDEWQSLAPTVIVPSSTSAVQKWRWFRHQVVVKSTTRSAAVTGADWCWLMQSTIRLVISWSRPFVLT